MSQPYDGVRVLELCSMVAGPFCARLLADLGAEVVKVESPIIGDETRRLGPFPQNRVDPDSSFLFSFLNTNKFGITLRVADPGGRDVLTMLLQQADVLIIDYNTQQRNEAKLNLEQISRENPRLVITTITPFGMTGSRADYKAYYLNTYHSGPDGYLNPSGRLANALYPNREPVRAGGYYGEYQCGLTAAVGTVAALYERSFSGNGHIIDMSKQEALVNLDPADVIRYANSRFLRTRFSRIPLYVGGLARCKDGFWILQLHFDRQWESLKKCMREPAWSDDPRFQTVEGRIEHRDELEGLIDEWAMGHTRKELYHMLQEAGVAAAPVLNPTEIVSDSQLKARGFFVETEVPGAGRVPMPSLPFKASEFRHTVARPAPRLGQHNRQVYRQWLGYQGQDIASLEGSQLI